MKIGIDARLYNETGVGRYIRNLIANLALIDNQNEYFIYLLPDDYKSLPLPNEKWHKRLADVKWHTIKEQIEMPLILLRDNLDLVHFPYFSVPILYPKKFVVTIHDLTISHFDTGRATTLPMPIYKIKRMAYNFALTTAIRRATKIITVSEFTKKEILEHYKVVNDKIAVTYEAGNMLPNLARTENSEEFTCESRISNIGFSYKYFLYVGNAHPHKNLEKLISAFSQLSEKDIKLVLIGNDNFFYPRLKQWVKEKGVDNVIFPGYVEDNQLPQWYQNAYAFIFPSLMEGFGLPALEAMENNCTVLAANNSSLPEICADAAIYFDPTKEEEIKNAMEKIIVNSSLRDELIEKGKSQSQKFSWEKMTKETLKIYQKCNVEISST